MQAKNPLDNFFKIYVILIITLKHKTAIALALLTLLLVGSTSVTFAQTPRGLGLTNGRLVACQAREKAVKNRMESLIDLVSNIESKFDSIAQRVENFYTNTVIPSGKTVPNYNTLIADISTKKDAVTTSLNKAQSDVTAFNCTANDPVTLLNTFRIDMQAVKEALKTYRTSIKNLIVAVHSESPSPSPEASEKP